MLLSLAFVRPQMTSWVSTEILQRRTPGQRAVVIEHFIQIAYYCYKHNDLHCALNITIALGSACIKSLRQTWNEVDKKVSGTNIYGTPCRMA